jgi:hypothetical protein
MASFSHCLLHNVSLHVVEAAPLRWVVAGVAGLGVLALPLLPKHRQAEWQTLVRIQGPEAWEGLVAGEGAGSEAWPRPPRAQRRYSSTHSFGPASIHLRLAKCKPTVMTAHAPQFARRANSRPLPHCCMYLTCICGVCARMHPGVRPKVTWGGQRQLCGQLDALNFLSAESAATARYDNPWMASRWSQT